MKAEITQEKLHDLFDYKDGNLYWREDGGRRAKAGSKAGNISTRGYEIIQINKKKYGSPRLIFLYHNGYFPENKIIKFDKSDKNKIENLEEASQSCIQSRQVTVRNSSKIKGVNESKIGGWRVDITHSGRQRINLGRRMDFLEACCLRYAAEQCLGWDQLSESPAAKYVKKHIQEIK